MRPGQKDYACVSRVKVRRRQLSNTLMSIVYLYAVISSNFVKHAGSSSPD